MLTLDKDELQAIADEAALKAMQGFRTTIDLMSEYELRVLFQNPNTGKLCSKATINRFIMKHKIPFTQVGDRRIFPRRTVEEVIKKSRRTNAQLKKAS
ncbi:MAG TPA: hypothetical protein VD996_02660 [Chitinophagaceae bacterium]|nr:hypothetical protein [Chitinophagaceae bacterium]